MTFRLHVFEDVFDLAIGTDHESRASDAHHFPAIHIFFFQYAELVGDLFVRIGQQHEWETVLVLKFLLRSGGVARNTGQDGARLFDLLVCVAEPARFFRSTGSIGLGVEK